MPRYIFHCPACKQESTEFRVSDERDRPGVCPGCRSKTERVFDPSHVLISVPPWFGKHTTTTGVVGPRGDLGPTTLTPRRWNKPGGF